MSAIKRTMDEKYDIFSPKKAKTGEDEKMVICYRANSVITKNQIIDIRCPPKKSYVTELKNSSLWLQVKIVNGKSDLVDDDKVCLVAYPITSLFKEVAVYVNGIQIGANVGSNFGIKNYIDLLLENDKNDLKNAGMGGMAILDEKNHMDASATNSSMGLRAIFYEQQ